MFTRKQVILISHTYILLIHYDPFYCPGILSVQPKSSYHFTLEMLNPCKSNKIPGSITSTGVFVIHIKVELSIITIPASSSTGSSIGSCPLGWNACSASSTRQPATLVRNTVIHTCMRTRYDEVLSSRRAPVMVCAGERCVVIVIVVILY